MDVLRGFVKVGWEVEKFRESEGFWGDVCYFVVFGRGLEIGRGVDVFGNFKYLGSRYEKGEDVDVFGGMECVGRE